MAALQRAPMSMIVTRWRTRLDPDQPAPAENCEELVRRLAAAAGVGLEAEAGMLPHDYLRACCAAIDFTGLLPYAEAALARIRSPSSPWRQFPEWKATLVDARQLCVELVWIALHRCLPELADVRRLENMVHVITPTPAPSFEWICINDRALFEATLAFFPPLRAAEVNDLFVWDDDGVAVLAEMEDAGDRTRPVPGCLDARKFALSLSKMIARDAPRLMDAYAPLYRLAQRAHPGLIPDLSRWRAPTAEEKYVEFARGPAAIVDCVPGTPLLPPELLAILQHYERFSRSGAYMSNEYMRDPSRRVRDYPDLVLLLDAILFTAFAFRTDTPRILFRGEAMPADRYEAERIRLDAITSCSGNREVALAFALNPPVLSGPLSTYHRRVVLEIEVREGVPCLPIMSMAPTYHNQMEVALVPGLVLKRDFNYPVVTLPDGISVIRYKCRRQPARGIPQEVVAWAVHTHLAIQGCRRHPELGSHVLDPRLYESANAMLARMHHAM